MGARAHETASLLCGITSRIERTSLPTSRQLAVPRLFCGIRQAGCAIDLQLTFLLCASRDTSVVIRAGDSSANALQRP
jgi:hypothetical protein